MTFKMSFALRVTLLLCAIFIIIAALAFSQLQRVEQTQVEDELSKVLQVNLHGHSSYYSFEGEGDQVLDDFASFWPGTLHGAVRSAGKTGKGLDFSVHQDAHMGVDICCKIGKPLSTTRWREVTFENGGISIAMWLKPLALEDKQIYPLYGGWYGDVQSNKLRVVDKRVELLIYSSSGYQPKSVVKSNTRLVNGQWTHVAVVHNGKQARLFINGELDAAQDANISVSSIVNDVFLGGIPKQHATQGKHAFAGVIDDFFMSELILTDKEVNALFNKDKLAAQQLGEN
ncbi:MULTISPECIES: LamG domain-containing protein [unclassified Pseudoalteromonas]|uniref:LamG domain-containing protein n=1 Tax=unclassified Pseudoalteromonas TaxID=194690 RepID=UPI000CF663DB|nr:MULTISPECIES: LamG domain-containing protein [unclassified Pseudoalteromonas]